MSYFCHEPEDDTRTEAEASVFDVLLAEIGKAEEELAIINRQLTNQPPGSVNSEAAVLGQEVAVMESMILEGLVEDPEIRYYLAVGKVEKQLEEMRQAKEVADQCLASHAASLKELDFKIQEQISAINRLEKEVADAELTGDSVEDANIVARAEISKQVRANKIILRELKSGLKKFIDCTAKLDPKRTGQDSSPFGYLLQALWRNYLIHGVEYLSIKDQEFDVPSHVLEHLVQAGIVRSHPNDQDKIRMEDFTCSD